MKKEIEVCPKCEEPFWFKLEGEKQDSFNHGNGKICFIPKDVG